MSQTTEPSVNDLSPVLKAGVENEPMFLIDTTGSMASPNAANGGTERRAVLLEALPAVVAKLAALDSQAAAESAAAGDDEGGVMTYTFADGGFTKVGDLNPGNAHQLLGAIRWGGGTVIMPGWTALQEGYMEEFGDRPVTDRPHLLAVIFTDGEANDTDEFAKALQSAKGGTYAVLCILGYGQEHDRAQAAYQAVAEANNHVRVVSFGNTDDPSIISDGVLSLLGVS
jgi:hypothetical protein